MENKEPGAWITPAMLDKIEADHWLDQLMHPDAYVNWPNRWKALREIVDKTEVVSQTGEEEG